MTNNWWQSAGRLLLPASCLLCGGPAPGSFAMCEFCGAELPRIVRACNRCALPLPGSGVCGHCLANPPGWESAIAAWSYSGVVPWLVRRFKFDGSLVHGNVLARGLAERICRDAVRPDVIVPVPLHRRRLRQRGFNQALELARPAAQCLGVRLDPALAQRIVSTAEQSSLDAAQRRRNVRGAFHVSRELQGASVAVVDDVMTTGNTVEELVRALRRAGAQSVQVWVCARAEPPPEKPLRKVISQ